jgi:hypothetical protein
MLIYKQTSLSSDEAQSDKTWRQRGQRTDELIVHTAYRQVPLVLLGVADRAAVEPLARRLHQEGMVVAVAQGERGCLRVATAIKPDIILLDPRLPRVLVSFLRAHPFSRHAHIAYSQALAAPVRAAVVDRPLAVTR